MALQDLTPQLRTRLSRMERAVGIFVGLAAVLLLSGFFYYLYHTAVRKGWFLTKATYYTTLERSPKYCLRILSRSMTFTSSSKSKNRIMVTSGFLTRGSE